jgi:hypothetical protein
MLTWAVVVLFIFFILITYIMTQGTRAAIAWRKAAEAGDLKVIRMIVEDAISAWRSQKRPRHIPPDVWRGVQSVQLTDLGPGFVRVSAQAQSEYRLVDGAWREVANPLQEGMAIAARLLEMLLYELPHYRPERVQVDVYTSFRHDEGPTENVCILTVSASREDARQVDWDEWTAEEIVDALEARYRLGEFGQPLPIEVPPPSGVLDEIVPEAPRGRRRATVKG